MLANNCCGAVAGAPGRNKTGNRNAPPEQPTQLVRADGGRNAPLKCAAWAPEQTENRRGTPN
eukprot:10565362-Lingulodinium_polyedra.AAC.1